MSAADLPRFLFAMTNLDWEGPAIGGMFYPSAASAKTHAEDCFCPFFAGVANYA